MAVLAAADEPDRRRLSLLSIGTEMVGSLRSFQILEPDEAASIGRVAGNRFASEPPRKQCRFDRARRCSGIAFVDRRRSQLRRLVADDPLVVLQAQMQQ